MVTNDSLNALLTQAALTAEFQPIVSLSRQSIIGFEGLIRGPKDSPLASPDALFDAAQQHQRLVELDFLCREVVIGEFAKLALPSRLFLNVHPISLADRRLINGHTLSCLERHGIDPARVVIEITETHPIEDLQLFQDALHHHREQGFKVALDDLGAGYAGLKLWSQSNPEFVKVDRHFIQGVDNDKTKQRFISAILEIAKALGCETITEGIETKNEYAVLRRLGVELAQGFYFARPHNPPVTKLDPTLFSERRERAHAQPFYHLTASCLLRACPSVEPTGKIDKLSEMFQLNPKLRSIPVVQSGEPQGVVIRDDFMSLMASRYGRDLHYRKPIRHFIQKRCLIVDKDESLEVISQRLTSAINHYADEFIITQGGHYLGMGSLMDLLGKITEMQVNKARYANPLTLLPGNVVIQQALEEALTRQEEFVVAYLDIDNFKPFNDAYGYGHGDEVLRLLGRLLQECTLPERDFVGHIGGDDFIVLMRNDDWRQSCETMVAAFGNAVEGFYSEEDRVQGGIVATDRFGTVRQFPIMAVSIGVIWIQGGHDRLSSERIAELATAAKSKAKGQAGSRIRIEVHAPNHTMDLWDMLPLTACAQPA